MKSSNLAIVFVDIAGFTERTGQQSRSESEAWLARFEELLLPLIKAFDGRRIKTIGDAYLCTFASPTNALLFGMAAQDRVHGYNLEAQDSEKFQIRVAVNAGEVRQQRRDVFGEPVNIAARVEGQTPAGEIWFTEAVNLAMTRSEIPAEEVGQRELKGIAEPIKLYRIPRDTNYRLRGSDSQDAPGAEAEAGEGPALVSYPFGGLGLKRAEERGWALTLGMVPLKLARAGQGATGHLRDLGERILSLPRTFWYATCGVLGLLLITVIAASLGGQFSDCLDALEQGQTARAQSLLEVHPDRKTPMGKAVQARIWLRGPDKRYAQAATQLEQVLVQRPDLLGDSDVIRDLVTSLNRRNAQATIDLLVNKVGSSAIDPLLQASRDRRFRLRWNSIKALQGLDAMHEVDLVAVYIQDLVHGGKCKLRKRAAQKLGQQKDPRALEPLRKAQQRVFLENLCMGQTLENAIEAIENR